MRQVRSPAELLAERFQPSGKAVVEVGCGTGELVRWLTGQGARVVGLHDELRRPEILEQARAITERRAAAAGIEFDDYRYRSTCRLNIMLALPLTCRKARPETRVRPSHATARYTR